MLHESKLWDITVNMKSKLKCLLQHMLLVIHQCMLFQIKSKWMNEWMMHLYSALLCIAVHPKRFTIMWGGVSPQPPPVCSIHLDDATAATGQRHQCAHHTPATGGEEREIEPIKWMGIIRRPWLTRASGGNLARTPGLHPYSFRRSAMLLLMTTESQDLSLTSHPKRCFLTVLCPRHYTGALELGVGEKNRCIDASRFSLQRFWIDSENFRIYCELSF